MTGDEVTYALEKGYTLDGTPNGERSFKITCTAAGAFTSTKVLGATETMLA